jgi:hypothetical protein
MKSHATWSKIYKDFMRGLGHDFPQTTLNDSNTAKQKLKSALYAELENYMGVRCYYMRKMGGRRP